MHDSNELSVLQYSEDSNHFDVSCVFSHPDQIWALDASPKDAGLVVTSRQSQNCSKALTLWKMAKQTANDFEYDNTSSYNNDRTELTEIASFNQNQKIYTVKDIKWHSAGTEILTVDSKILSLWSVADGKISVS